MQRPHLGICLELKFCMHVTHTPRNDLNHVLRRYFSVFRLIFFGPLLLHVRVSIALKIKKNTLARVALGRQSTMSKIHGLILTTPGGSRVGFTIIQIFCPKTHVSKMLPD